LTELAALTTQKSDSLNASYRDNVYEAAKSERDGAPVLLNRTYDLGITVVEQGDSLMVRVQLDDEIYGGKNNFRDYPLQETELADFLQNQAKPTRDNLIALNSLCSRARRDFRPDRVAGIKKLILASARQNGIKGVVEMPEDGEDKIPSLVIDHGTVDNYRST